MRLPDLPIACNLGALNDAERGRRAALIKQLAQAHPAVDELADGFVFRFRRAPEVVPAIAELTPLELRCCPFLALEFVPFEPDYCELRIRGPEGSKAIIASGFGLERRKDVEGG